MNLFKDGFENFLHLHNQLEGRIALGTIDMSNLHTSLVSAPSNSGSYRQIVDEAMRRAPVFDMHTHLFPPSFGKLSLWGIDELLTYHYLEAEFFRMSSLTPQQYFALPKRDRADQIWECLFVRHSPLSEACRGVIAVLDAFGLPTDAPDLRRAREYFREQNIDRHVDMVLSLSGVEHVVMTNDPLDPAETPFWTAGSFRDARFHAALRLDRLLNEWDTSAPLLAAQGYEVTSDRSGKTIAEVRRFLDEWVWRMDPLYMAISLPDTFEFPDASPRAWLLADAVLSACREHRLPLAAMIGVRRSVNPSIGIAADGLGRADLRSVVNLCRQFPENRFLVTVLSLENQHELCVCARKFSNLTPFGCWWFLNNGSIVSAITGMRLEMLGASFIPQHSDARVLEQLIYKWRSARCLISEALTTAYGHLSERRRPVTNGEIERDVHLLLYGNFEAVVNYRGAHRRG